MFTTRFRGVQGAIYGRELAQLNEIKESCKEAAADRSPQPASEAIQLEPTEHPPPGPNSERPAKIGTARRNVSKSLAAARRR